MKSLVCLAIFITSAAFSADWTEGDCQITLRYSDIEKHGLSAIDHFDFTTADGARTYQASVELPIVEVKCSERLGMTITPVACKDKRDGDENCNRRIYLVDPIVEIRSLPDLKNRERSYFMTNRIIRLP